MNGQKNTKLKEMMLIIVKIYDEIKLCRFCVKVLQYQKCVMKSLKTHFRWPEFHGNRAFYHSYESQMLLDR